MQPCWCWDGKLSSHYSGSILSSRKHVAKFVHRAHLTPFWPFENERVWWLGLQWGCVWLHEHLGMPCFVFLMFVMAAFSQFWCVDCNCSHVGCYFLDVLVLERSNAGWTEVFPFWIVGIVLLSLLSTLFIECVCVRACVLVCVCVLHCV